MICICKYLSVLMIQINNIFVYFVSPPHHLWSYTELVANQVWWQSYFFPSLSYATSKPRNPQSSKEKHTNELITRLSKCVDTSSIWNIFCLAIVWHKNIFTLGTTFVLKIPILFKHYQSFNYKVYVFSFV